MAQTAPTPADALPPAPSTSAPLTFAGLADAFVAALATLRTQFNNLATNVYNNAVDAYNNATAAAASATAAAASANIDSMIGIAVSDETSVLTTGIAKVKFRAPPFAFTVTGVYVSLNVASSSGLPTFDINEGGVSILSTKLTCDVGETTSTTAAAPAVISDANLAANAEISIDIDVAGTGAAGAKIYLIGNPT